MTLRVLQLILIQYCRWHSLNDVKWKQVQYLRLLESKLDTFKFKSVIVETLYHIQCVTYCQFSTSALLYLAIT